MAHSPTKGLLGAAERGRGRANPPKNGGKGGSRRRRSAAVAVPAAAHPHAVHPRAISVFRRWTVPSAPGTGQPRGRPRTQRGCPCPGPADHGVGPRVREGPPHTRFARPRRGEHGARASRSGRRQRACGWEWERGCVCGGGSGGRGGSGGGSRPCRLPTETRRPSRPPTGCAWRRALQIGSPCRRILRAKEGRQERQNRKTDTVNNLPIVVMGEHSADTRLTAC